MGRVTAEARAGVRRRLLEAAAEHFARDGLDGASVDAIAIAAGVAKGTLYNYFASKEELFAQVLERGCRLAAERSATPPGERSVREHLLSLAAADVAVLQEEERFMQVVVREAMSFRPETYPLIVDHLAPYVAKVEEVLERGAARGEIRRDRPPAQLALLFVGTLVLLFVQHWGSGGAWPTLEEIPELAVSIFLDGAHPPGRRSRSAPARGRGGGSR